MSIASIEFKYSNKQSIRTFLISTIFEYFSPLYITWKKTDALKKESDALLNSKRALNAIQDANCFNQSALIQFTYLMAEKHKDIKDEYRSHKKYTPELEDKVRSLVYFLNQDFHKNIFHNFEILHSYFCGRSKHEPRISIKGNFKTHHKDIIVSIFRDAEVLYESDADISENTGFSTIAKNGKYFLCNDIPALASKGNYKNPRLDIDSIKKAASKNKNKAITQSWKKYWHDSSLNMDEKAFYKSTLIIPMTLWNNQLSDEFRKKIDITNIGRTIFGFLCLDNVDESFFIEDDIRVGYVFADLLSQYIFHRSVYTDYSETFSDVLDTINSSIDITPKKLSPSLSWECMKTPSDIMHSIELEESSDNYLFGLDEKLMDYLEKNTHITKS